MSCICTTVGGIRKIDPLCPACFPDLRRPVAGPFDHATLAARGRWTEGGETIEQLRMAAQMNADTVRGLHSDNAQLRVRVRELETKLAAIARLAAPADPFRDDPGPVPLDAVFRLTLGFHPRQAGRLRKITGDSKNGVALRDLIAATATICTRSRETMHDSEDVEQRACDLLDAVIDEVVATIPD